MLFSTYQIKRMLLQILNKFILQLHVLLLIVLMSSSFQGAAQLFDDFSDGNLNNNPAWFGEPNEFTINDDFQLQSNAQDAGSSFIYTEIEFIDSVRWHFYFKMKFSPSDNNNVDIYLAMDSTDPTTTNGYRLHGGENLSDDALVFERIENGVPTVLGIGQLGGIANSPAEAECIIEKTKNGNWSFSFGYDGSFPVLEFEVMEDLDLTSYNYFGIACKYTSSNTGNFFFDDIYIEELLPDITGPSLVSASLKTPNTLSLIFSEAIDEASLSSTANYSISPNVGDIDMIVYNENNPTNVDLVFTNDFESGILYTISVDGVFDTSLNSILPDQSADFVFVSRPSPGDLKLSEILFNPSIGGEDYVELINTSTKFISLDSLRIKNALGDKIEILETDYVIYPDEYIAISENVDFLLQEYNTPAEAQFLTHDLPGFNVDTGNVSIAAFLNNQWVTIDSFDYNEDLHFILLDEVKGVSLERLSYDVESSKITNWASAGESVNFGTPGYKNSNNLILATGEDAIFLTTDVFSPNGDGQNDQLVVQYELDKTGYVLNAAIFNDRGFSVKTFANNRLLSSSDLMTWDGLDDDNQKMPIGIYILYLDLFHPDGELINRKIPFVLADFLD